MEEKRRTRDKYSAARAIYSFWHQYPLELVQHRESYMLPPPVNLLISAPDNKLHMTESSQNCSTHTYSADAAYAYIQIETHIHLPGGACDRESKLSLISQVEIASLEREKRLRNFASVQTGPRQ
jgi:hypothetical protein